MLRAPLHYTSTTRMPTEDGYDRTWLQDISYDGLKKLARVHGIAGVGGRREVATGATDCACNLSVPGFLREL